MRRINNTEATTHTSRENTCSPGTCTGNVTPAVATMPVPITDANQLGPKCCSRASSVVMAQSMFGHLVDGGRLAAAACFDGRMQISLSIVGLNTAGPAPVDALVRTLAKLRDEGFRRVWLAQLPYDVDLPIALGIALREVDGIEVGSAVIPIQVQ